MQLFFLVVFGILVSFCAAPVAAANLSRFLIEAAPHAMDYAVTQQVDRLRFELRAGDCAKAFDCETGRERSEIKEPWRAPIDRITRYSFNLMLPADYPEMAPKQILGQWHDGARPALSNRYEQGRFWIDLMGGTNKTSHRFEISSFQKGKWQRLTYAVRWSPDSAGLLKVWHNGQLVADYRGPTLSADWSRRPRFKFGIYRSHLQKLDGPAPTQIAYFSGYERRQVRSTETEDLLRAFRAFR